MSELNDIINDMNELEMSLTSAWEDDEKNFSHNFSIFSSNDVIM